MEMLPKKKRGSGLARMRKKSVKELEWHRGVSAEHETKRQNGTITQVGREGAYLWGEKIHEMVEQRLVS